MQRLQAILAEILQEAGELQPLTLGPDTTKISASPELKKRLMERLFVQSKFNNRIVIVFIMLLFLIYLMALALVYYNRDSPTAVSLILGGSVLSLLGITRSLSSLWRTKVSMDVLIAILPSLSPEQAIQAIKDLYYHLSEPSTKIHTDTELT